jgi:cytochrome d ubiquinol oxidase subunit I
MTVLLTIIGFSLIYTVLFIVEMSLMVRAVRHGPDPDPEPEAALAPSVLVAAE